MREYGLVDGDAHILEAPDLWLKRLPSKYTARAPRQQRFEKGDAWIFEGARGPISYGRNAVGATPGGMKPTDRRAWIRWEEINPAAIDPAQRLMAMDEDGVRAAVLYPTPAVSAHLFLYNADRDFHLALIRAYNDWLSDFCSTDVKRLGLLAMLPTTGVQDAIAELRRTRKLPAFRGAILGRWPTGDLYVTDADDAFFAEAEAANVPLSIHVSLAQDQPNLPSLAPGRKGAVGDMRHLDAPVRAKDLVTTGVFDRFPRLTVVFVEVDCGWVPYVKEQLDDRFKRLEPDNKPDIKMRPSEYFDRNLAFTFVNDTYGIQNRHRVGLGSIIWSSDFPHSGTDWPHSWRVIEEAFAGVPGAEKRQILVDNAARIYGF